LQPASEPSSWQPPHQIGRFVASNDSAHHGGMMCGDGVGTEGGIGTREEVFCSMGFLTSINHGGRRRPTATMRPQSWCRSIQQSANMIGNRFVSLKLEKSISINNN